MPASSALEKVNAQLRAVALTCSGVSSPSRGLLKNVFLF